MNVIFTLHTDGGARGNPGPSAIGGVLLDPSDEKIAEFSEFTGISTNNVAEYTALIKGLSIAFTNRARNLNCFLDSELVVKQLNGQYKVKSPGLKILFEKVIDLKNKFDSISFTHIRRDKNFKADKLVNKALDSFS